MNVVSTINGSKWHYTTDNNKTLCGRVVAGGTPQTGDGCKNCVKKHDATNTPKKETADLDNAVCRCGGKLTNESICSECGAIDKNAERVIETADLDNAVCRCGGKLTPFKLDNDTYSSNESTCSECGAIEGPVKNAERVLTPEDKAVVQTVIESVLTRTEEPAQTQPEKNVIPANLVDLMKTATTRQAREMWTRIATKRHGKDAVEAALKA